MKKILTLFIFSVAAYHAKCQSWTMLPYVTHAALRACTFGDNNTIYATGEAGSDSSTLLKSTNGGISFFHIGTSFLPTGHLLNETFFTGADTGFVASYKYDPTVSYYEAFAIYRTTDGGSTWTSVLTGVNGKVVRVRFANPSIGYAVTTNFSSPCKVYRTSDGGITWIPIYTSTTNFYPFDMELLDAGTGFIVGRDAASNTAATLPITAGSVTGMVTTSGYTHFTSVHFTSPANGWVYAMGSSSGPNHLLKTADGGVTWTSMYSSMLNNSEAMKFGPDGSAFLLGEGVLTSGDTGGTWTLMDTTLFEYHPTQFAMDIRNGVRIIVGEYGRIYRQGPGTEVSYDTRAGLNIQVYPNPARGQCIVDLGKNWTDACVRIFDVTGKIVYKSSVTASECIIDTRELRPGVYVLRVSDEENEVEKRLELSN